MLVHLRCRPLALIVLGVGGAFVLGLVGGKAKTPPRRSTPSRSSAAAEHAVFYDLPDILVNLNTGDGKAELSQARHVARARRTTRRQQAIEAGDAAHRRQFQVYLRELRVEDLSGSAGVYRLSEELVARVNVAVAPVEVRDVLLQGNDRPVGGHG